MWKTFKNLIWPKKCINCGQEGSYLCPDCFALIDISRQPPSRDFKYLDALYFPTTYDEKIVQSAIHLCKYSYIRELSETLADLIIAHFQLLDKPLPATLPARGGLRANPPADLLCAVPLHKTKLKQRGFNQAEEIAQHLSKFLKVPFLPDVLVKIKKTPSQTALSKEERKKNVSGVFKANPQKQKMIEGKNIFLVDDILTTGATMEECAKILKQNLASSVWGVVVARD